MVWICSKGTSESTSCTALPIAETTLSGSVCRAHGKRHAEGLPRFTCAALKAGPGAGKTSAAERVWLNASSFTSPTTPTTTRGHGEKSRAVRRLPIGSWLGQNCFGHRLADQNGAGMSHNVRVVKLAPAQQRDMHGAHVTGADQTHIKLWLIGHGHEGPALHLHRLVRAITAERQSVDDAGGLDARQRANPFQHAVKEADLLRRWWRISWSEPTGPW